MSVRLKPSTPSGRAAQRSRYCARTRTRYSSSAPLEATDEDKFVADNFALLKASGLVEAGVPRELGGGGADIDELAAMLRTLGAIIADRPRWRFPCTPIRSRFRPGAGRIRRPPPSNRC